MAVIAVMCLCQLWFVCKSLWKLFAGEANPLQVAKNPTQVKKTICEWLASGLQVIFLQAPQWKHLQVGVLTSNKNKFVVTA